MKFMIKHDLPLVRGGSRWQYRSVTSSCNYGHPTGPQNVNPRTATDGSLNTLQVISKTKTTVGEKNATQSPYFVGQSSPDLVKNVGDPSQVENLFLRLSIYSASYFEDIGGEVAVMLQSLREGGSKTASRSFTKVH